MGLGTTLKLYVSVANELKLKVRQFLELIPKFVELAGEKMVRVGVFLSAPLLPS